MKMRRFHTDPGESKPRIFSHVKNMVFSLLWNYSINRMFLIGQKTYYFDEVSTRGRYIPENVLDCGNHIQPFSARWLSVQLFSTLMNEIVTFVTNLKNLISNFGRF